MTQKKTKDILKITIPQYNFGLYYKQHKDKYIGEQGKVSKVSPSIIRKLDIILTYIKLQSNHLTDMDELNGFIDIHSKYFKELHHHPQFLLRFLEEIKLIEINHFFKFDADKTKEFNPENSQTKKYKLVTKTINIVEGLLNANNQALTIQKEIEVELSNAIFSTKASVRPTGYLSRFYDFYDNLLKNNISFRVSRFDLNFTDVFKLNSINKLYNNQLLFTHGSSTFDDKKEKDKPKDKSYVPTYFRLYTNFTNLHTEVRDTLLINNKETTTLDIKNSQLQFLLKYLINNKLPFESDIAELITEGRIYEFLVHHVKINIDTFKTDIELRKICKTLMLRYLFCEPSKVRYIYEEDARIGIEHILFIKAINNVILDTLEDKFPLFSKSLYGIKDRKKLAYEMQSVEAELVVFNISSKLIYMGIPHFTVHDSITLANDELLGIEFTKSILTENGLTFKIE